MNKPNDMKKALLYCVYCGVLAAVLTSCGGATQKGVVTDSSELSVAEAEIPTHAVEGKWNIENVVVSDTLNARPADIDPKTPQYFTFADGQYSVTTNCNTLQGSYEQKGDSIVLGDGPATLMACDRPQVEDLLRQVIPQVKTVDFVNDSTLRLNSDGSAYIVLTKAAE